MDMSLSKLWELVMDREAAVLQFMESQRAGHDWATERNWNELNWTEWTEVVIKSFVNSTVVAEILPSHGKQSIMASVIISSEAKNKKL